MGMRNVKRKKKRVVLNSRPYPKITALTKLLVTMNLKMIRQTMRGVDVDFNIFGTKEWQRTVSLKMIETSIVTYVGAVRLFTGGFCTQAQSTCRAVLEAVFYLHYLIERKDSYSFRVGQLLLDSVYNDLNCVTTTSKKPTQEREMENLEKDRYLISSGREEYSDEESGADYFNEILGTPFLQAAKSCRITTTDTNGSRMRNPKWYQVDNRSLSNLRLLAEHLKMGGVYDNYYGAMSQAGHLSSFVHLLGHRSEETESYECRLLLREMITLISNALVTVYGFLDRSDLLDEYSTEYHKAHDAAVKELTPQQPYVKPKEGEDE